MMDSYEMVDKSMTQNPRIVGEVIEVPVVTNTNNINDIKADLSAIIEYAEEPLVVTFWSMFIVDEHSS